MTADEKIQFISPDYIYHEIHKHLPEIIQKTGITKQAAGKTLKNITKNVTFYAADDVPTHLFQEAVQIVRDIDIDDAPFVALHLFKRHKIWTGDTALINGLKNKGYNICITTQELRKKIYKSV
ncbi:MAG: PIN domain-containing protein [Bacteroidia bacterium]|nr:PIN domain-containing protein [Bacteroidia bacterium]